MPLQKILTFPFVVLEEVNFTNSFTLTLCGIERKQLLLKFLLLPFVVFDNVGIFMSAPLVHFKYF